MYNVTFMGNPIQVQENAESQYAVDNFVSLEVAMKTVNNNQGLSFDNIERGLRFLLNREVTSEEVMACLEAQI